MRKFKYAHQDIIENNFQGITPLGYLGKSLKNKTLGIIGLGRIGKKVAKICHEAFGMNIVYYNQNSRDLNYTFMELDNLFKTADIISFHCPLTETTRNLLSKEKFKLLKNDVVIINTARGEVINQNELIQFLNHNPNSFAGLDVTDPEPLPINHEILKLKNIYILPHIGSATIETREEMALLTARNIINYGSTEDIKSIIRPK